ncbi:cytochrome b [Noviherbaspirillum galbum]|uniref:Cytochrome b n=1 Tax=Noviherbaspirillum galbum TaxID=2709383 RepID=A0A6B3SQN8_9BURK|nr:cytochrome b [Noviherbaspirillum galbum]NEX61066.1 cytochrome b [Noviherbaspirillum galbum]
MKPHPELHYSRPAIALHWIMAVLLTVLIAMGLFMVGLPKRTPAVGFYYNMHKSLGLVALALVVIRMAWRLHRAAPALETASPGSRIAARATHVMMYLLMLWVPACGFLATSFGKHPVSFFGYALPRLFAENAMLLALFRQLHMLFAWALLSLIAVHLLGVIWHVRLEGSRFIRRMLPA